MRIITMPVMGRLPFGCLKKSLMKRSKSLIFSQRRTLRRAQRGVAVLLKPSNGLAGFTKLLDVVRNSPSGLRGRPKFLILDRELGCEGASALEHWLRVCARSSSPLIAHSGFPKACLHSFHRKNRRWRCHQVTRKTPGAAHRRESCVDRAREDSESALE